MTSPDQSQDPLDRLPWTKEVPTEPGVYLWRSGIYTEPRVRTIGGGWLAAGTRERRLGQWCRVPERSEELECCGSPIGCEALHAGMCPDERPRG